MGFKQSERRNRIYATGSDHPSWQGGSREKTCAFCGRSYGQRPKEPLSSFLKRKFCGKECIRLGEKRLYGKDNPKYRVDARRRNRGGTHRKWVNAVINRDEATCQNCGARGVELHAHHVKAYQDFPELRFDVSNGLTLCFECHWNLHAAQNEKAVNSVDTLRGNAEPSLQGNLLEGVTTRGRAYRRWQGRCEQCSIFISKPLSDIKGKKHLFCSKKCAATFSAKNRTLEHRRNISMANSGKRASAETKKRMSIAQRRRYAKAVISSTNAAPEREDIV